MGYNELDGVGLVGMGWDGIRVLQPWVQLWVCTGLTQTVLVMSHQPWVLDVINHLKVLERRTVAEPGTPAELQECCRAAAVCCRAEVIGGGDRAVSSRE